MLARGTLRQISNTGFREGLVQQRTPGFEVERRPSRAFRACGPIQGGDDFGFDVRAFVRMQLIVAGIQLGKFHPELRVVRRLAGGAVQHFEGLAELPVFLINGKQIAVSHKQLGIPADRRQVGLDRQVRFPDFGIGPTQPGEHLARSLR